nr:reverse transcriptase domain-containing protein [Tanacetum cinerariifolium]
MENARHERLKDVHARLDFGEGVEKASAALENHTVILSPTLIVTKVVTIQKEETGLRHPVHRGAIQAKKSTQKKYVKDPVEIHNIKQRDEETLEDFMERFKIETGRMKGAPECIRIYGFMHGINNPELTKRLNEHVPKTMEEMMIATTAFIRGEAMAASKKKDQSPPPMVTPVEKRNSNKFYDFHNDKGDITDECMQLKKQIEELVRAEKLSHLFKEIKQGQEHLKTGRKDAEAKDKPMTIYMGIVTIRSSLLIPAECASVDTSFVTPREKKTRPANLTITLHLNFLDQEVVVGVSLSDRGRAELCSLLKKNLDIFAWQPSDKTGVPRSIAEHRLNIREGCLLVRQKKRGQAPERAKAIQAEVQKLVEAGIMREVYYHDWLSNPIMVKKHDGSWRICVDFTDLNKACPQDCYPLPEIDWKVESLCGYRFKCFSDAYKGYHQIQLAETDKEKTAFHTGQGVYCYTKMPFGLKNAGATYQRLMDKPFKSQMGRNIEVYVDDLVVKSHTEAEMVRDIEETFQTLRKINMKLNPKNDRSDYRKEYSLAKQAFQQLKQHLSDLPLLVAPKPQEELIMYLFATHGVISAVLMTERGAAQMSIYFISRALKGPELNYSPTEKLVLSLVFAATRLRRYFQTHPITVITDQPIKQVMSRPDVAGRLQKWSIVLGEHNITYRPRTSIKGQIPADFLNKIPGNASQGVSVAVTQEEPWTLFTDGSSCVDGSATQMGVKNVQVNVDSLLVANQVLGTYVSKEDNMIKYLEIAKGLVSGFKTFSISQVPRSRNKKADALSKIASTSFTHLSKQVLVEVLETKFITGKEVTAVIVEEGPTWMMELVNYLKEGILPGDEKEARKLRLKAHQYELMEGVLYKRSFLTPWLRCVGPLQAEYVIKEIHEGLCSMHAGPWPFSGRAGEGQVPNSRNGLLHEVNRSKGGGNDYRRTGEEIRMGQYYMPLRYSGRNNLRQWQTVRVTTRSRTEIGMPTYRTIAVDVVNNDEELRLNLDLLEERRELTAMSEAKSKSTMIKYYNFRVRGVAFKLGDFVYRSNDASHAVADGKLGPK